MQISKRKPSELQLKQWITKRIEHGLLELQSPAFWARMHAQVPNRLRPFIGVIFPILKTDLVAKNLNYALDWLQPILVRHNFRMTKLLLNEMEFELVFDPGREQKLTTSTLAVAFEAALKAFFEQHLRQTGFQFEIDSIRFTPVLKRPSRNKSQTQISFHIGLASDEWDRFFLKTQIEESVFLQLTAQYNLTQGPFKQEGQVELELHFTFPTPSFALTTSKAAPERSK